jgi:hypothetical protein
MIVVHKECLRVHVHKECLHVHISLFKWTKTSIYFFTCVFAYFYTHNAEYADNW